MSPTSSFPAWGLAKGLGIPRESEDLWDWTVVLLQNGGNKDSTLRGHKENHVHTRTQGEGAVSQEMEPDIPMSVGGLLRRCGLAVACCMDHGPGSSSPGRYPLE